MRISGFGATGPYADYLWDDIVVQAVSGSLLLQGHPEREPLRLPGHLALYFVGHMAALGALAAIGAARCRPRRILRGLLRRGGPGHPSRPPGDVAVIPVPERRGALCRPGRGDHGHPHTERRLSLCRWLHGHDVNSAAAQRDARGAGRPGGHRRPSRTPTPSSGPRPRKPSTWPSTPGCCRAPAPKRPPRPRRPVGPWPASTWRTRSSRPTTCTSAVSGSTLTMPEPARSIFPGRGAASARAVGPCAAWPRRSDSTTRRSPPSWPG